MSPSKQQHEQQPESRYAHRVIGAALALFFVYFIFLAGTKATANASVLGQLGDFVGGLLNPLVGLFTITLLVVNLKEQRNAIGIQAKATEYQSEAIDLQRKAIELQTTELGAQRQQLELQRDEQAKATAALQAQNLALAKQSAEQSLFSWLRAYRDMVTEIGVGGEGAARFLRANYSRFHSDAIAIQIPHSSTKALNGPPTQAEYVEQAIRNWSGEDVHALDQWLKSALVAFETVLDEDREALEPMLESIPAILDWIDLSDVPQLEKWKYGSIVLSHISWIERIYLLFYGCTPNGAKLAHFANKYPLFAGLSPGTNLLIRLIQAKMQPLKRPARPDNFVEGWPYKPSAFDADLALKQFFQ